MDRQVGSKHLGFLINDVARLLRRAFDKRAQGCGLTRAQWQVLTYLLYNENQNQAQLAEALDMEPITLSRHIDRLEAMGCVVRLPDPADRRARRLQLTESVKPQLQSMKSVGAGVLAAALDGVDPADLERMIVVLTQMRKNMAGRGIEGCPGEETIDRETVDALLLETV